MREHEDLARQVAAMGDTLRPEQMQRSRALYAPILEALGGTGVRTTRDLAYGPHPRHVLDVHVPEQDATEPRPVLLFAPRRRPGRARDRPRVRRL